MEATFPKIKPQLPLLRDGNDAKDTRHTCRSNTQGPNTSLFCSWPSGGTVATSKASFRASHAHGLQGTQNLLSPSAAGGITCQQMAATSLRCASHCNHLSLSLSFRCLCIPQRCLHISSRCLHTSSQRLSRHQWTLTQRTEHRHSSLKLRTHFRCLCIS